MIVSTRNPNASTEERRGEREREGERERGMKCGNDTTK